MKFFRLLLIWLGVLVGLAAAVVGALFTSPLQTWIARGLLDRQAGLKSSVGEVSAGLNHVNASDLHLEMNGAVLTLPSLQVALPVKLAGWDHRWLIRSFVAKDWTLDLSNLPESEPDSPSSGAVAASASAGETAKSESGAIADARKVAPEKIAAIVRRLLAAWELPCDVTLDGLELEGDVLVAVAADGVPVRVHVVIKGGGLAPGREGNFAIDASAADPSHGLDAVAAHGHLTLGLNTPRTLNHVAYKTDVTIQSRAWPEGFVGEIGLKATHTAGELAFAFDVLRDRRQVATVTAKVSANEPRLRGEWAIDERGGDLAMLRARPLFAALAVVGSGKFASAPDFSDVQLDGSAQIATQHAESLTPALQGFDHLRMANAFNLEMHGSVLRVLSWTTTLAGADPVADLRALQPFEFDFATRQVQPNDPTRDWLKVVVQGVPVAGWAQLPGQISLTGGKVTGALLIRADKNGLAARTTTPFHAAQVAVNRGSRALGRDLEVSAEISATAGAEGWTLKAEPLTIASGGHALANLTLASTCAGNGKLVTLNGTWSADLDAMAGQPALATFAGMIPRTASGDFNATLDSAIDANGKITVIGHNPGRTLTASVHAESVSAGAIEFKVPFTITLGKDVSVFSAEGTARGTDTGVHLTGRLNGEDVDLEHVGLIANALAGAWGLQRSAGPAADQPAAAAPPIVGDARPFWQGWLGEVTVAFDRLRSGRRVFNSVGATLDVDDSAIQVTRAWIGVSSENPAQAEGSLKFDATAAFPYQLKVTATVNELESASWLGELPKGQDPVLEGHFSLATTLTGDGRTPAELMDRMQENYQLRSKNGIIRLLKTSVSDALPDEPPTPVSDAAGTVGGWVGWLAGVKKDSIVSNEKPVAKNTDAVLNLTSQIGELGYDQLSVTATRGHDGVVRLTAIEVLSPHERLTGSGQIAANPNLPLASRPLTMDLKLGVRGNEAGLMTVAGLLAAKNDELGYLQLARTTPLHFGGTLQKPDVTDWHDLLAKAALPPPSAKPAKE